jgi:uncharacterized membrane protein
MDKMLVVVVFNSERQAYEGVQVLKDLHAEFAITLYDEAVIAKDTSGRATVKEAADRGPLGMAVGLVAGSLVGLLGGPVGVAVGAAAGTVVGYLHDAAHWVVNWTFLEEVARRLESGKAAVVAEVWEEQVLPVDMRMEAVGGVDRA